MKPRIRAFSGRVTLLAVLNISCAANICSLCECGKGVWVPGPHGHHHSYPSGAHATFPRGLGPAKGPPTVRERFFLGCCWAGGWVCGATMATGGVWAAGVTAGGVVGVKGEVGVEGADAAGLGPLLYMGALCLNCAGSAGLGVLGSSGGLLACRPASREDGAVNRGRSGKGLAGPGTPHPPPRLEKVGGLHPTSQALTAGTLAHPETSAPCPHSWGQNHRPHC